MIEAAASRVFQHRIGWESVHQSRATSGADPGQRYDHLAVDCGPETRVSRASEIGRRRSELLVATCSTRFPGSPLATDTATTNSTAPLKLRSGRHLGRLAALRGFNSAGQHAVCPSLEKHRQVGAKPGGSPTVRLQLFTEDERRPGGTDRRYQAVFHRHERGETWFLIKLWVDPAGRLLEWSRETEPFPFPTGESLAEMHAEIVRMYVDACSWRPVAYDMLRRGMSFERMLSIEERVRLADAFDKMRAVMTEAQAKTQGPSETGGAVAASTKQDRAAASRARGRQNGCFDLQHE